MSHLSKIILISIGLLFLIDCSSDDDMHLNATERKLIGKWRSIKRVVVEPGMPPNEIISSLPAICFMEFINRPANLYNSSSPIFSNTKHVQDNKDCSWLANAWKIDNNGKLLLASLDTVYADILKISNDSLIFKMNVDNYYGPDNHYQAEITYYLKRY